MCWDSGGWQNLQAKGIQLSFPASGWQKWNVSTKKDHRGPNSLLPAEQRSSQRRGFCGRLSRTFCEVLWITLDLVNILWITLDLEIGFVFPEKEPEIPTTLCKKNKRLGTSLVAQWLRIRLPMQGTQVRALVREDPTCRRATKPVCYDYWACTLEPASHNYWAPVPQLLKPARLEPVLRNTRSPHTATKSSPPSPQLEKARAQQRRPNAAINKLNNFLNNKLITFSEPQFSLL